MIVNLFSRFDPISSFIGLSLNWRSTFLGFLFVPYLFWAIPTRWSIAWNLLLSTLYKEFKVILKDNPRGTIFFISLFTLIVFNNLLGLIPYVFTRTRHLAITLSLALPMWLSFIIYGWLNHPQSIFAHLVPAGTPGALAPFIVLIETVRNIIRPGTLAVRLSANIIAGHLLLTLLGNTGPDASSSQLLINILINAQILLLLLETAVAVIQSYVFAVLTTLYAREVN